MGGNLIMSLWFWIGILLSALFFLSGYQLGKRYERRRQEAAIEETEEGGGE